MSNGQVPTRPWQNLAGRSVEDGVVPGGSLGCRTEEWKIDSDSNVVHDVSAPARPWQDFHARNRKEMRTIAEAVDSMLMGDLARAADILISRFSAVELASTTKHWNVARHLELIPPQDVSSIPTELMDYATGAEKREARSVRARSDSH